MTAREGRGGTSGEDANRAGARLAEEAARRWQQLVGFANTVRAQAAHCVRADEQVWPPEPAPADADQK